MSRNLVELVRRHHDVGAPTALEVLKAAMERRGEITDDDRRLAARRSGLPEAAVHGPTDAITEISLLALAER
jgi:hypothetical protein